MAGTLSPKLSALLDRGIASHRAGDVQAALAMYNAVLKKKPLQADALWLKGSAYVSLGDGQAAVEWLTKAAKRRPNDAAIINDLGMAYEAAGDIPAARDAYSKAYALNSDVPSTRVNVARFALKDGDAAKALEEADKAIKAQPNLVEAHNVRGLALQAANRDDEALAAFAVALAQSPNDSGVLFNKGALLRSKGDIEGAKIALERAVIAAKVGSDDWAKSKMTLGLAYVDVGDYAAAGILYNEVLAHDPDHVETLINRADNMKLLGDIPAAEQGYDAALELEDDNATARSNRAFIHLVKRNWATGWDDHEARWAIEQPASVHRGRGIPPWDGSGENAPSVLVWGEQGLGDQILYLAPLDDLVATGARPTLELDPRLVPVAQRSFPDIEVFEYGALDDDQLLEFDYQIPVGSLGRFLRRSADAFPEPKPYMKADPILTNELRKAYVEKASGRKLVGLAWNSVNPKTGARKSLPLEQWDSILSEADSLFVSLQYGDVEEAVTKASEATGANIFVDGEIDPITDFDAAAAQVAAMDLVIATSNTAVHLAGALGKTVWVMVPAIPAWRWGLEGDSAPWYPNLRIFRQPEPGDWASVINDVTNALAEWQSKS